MLKQIVAHLRPKVEFGKGALVAKDVRLHDSLGIRAHHDQGVAGEDIERWFCHAVWVKPAWDGKRESVDCVAGYAWLARPDRRA